MTSTNNTLAASFKGMIKEGTIKRADAMKVRYCQIHTREGFNLRELDDEYEAGIEELTAYIFAGGPLPPLEVVPLPSGAGVEVVDGHRRHDAIGRAIQRGAPIESLPRKVVSPLISSVDDFIGALDTHQKATLLDIQNGRVASGQITVEARQLLELFDAHSAVEAARERQAVREKKRKEAALAATQQDLEQ